MLEFFTNSFFIEASKEEIKTEQEETERLNAL